MKRNKTGINDFFILKPILNSNDTNSNISNEINDILLNEK